jgi:hypothetical protein
MDILAALAAQKEKKKEKKKETWVLNVGVDH